ncbi:MAG TPA: hypothetical protein VH478_25500 [Trebonia sp.]|jgi:hypothetical protein|nr:hypothetical protein [Trebonia sp.]
MTYDPYHGRGNGYREYPQDVRMPEWPEPSVPPSVVSAVRGMYLGAAVSVISVIIGLATSGSVSPQIRHARPDLTPSQVSAYAQLNLVSVIVLGLLGIGLWIWLALTIGRGRNWARVTGTALFAVDTLLQAVAFHQPIPFTARIPGLVIWLIGLVVVTLLWRAGAREFFGRRVPGESWDS